MRFNNKFLILFLLLLIPTAAATTIFTEKAYTPGSEVTITGTCNSPNIWAGLEIAIGSPAKTIMVDQVMANSNKQYSTSFVAPQSGTYTIYASCQGETPASATLCVGTAAECGIVPIEQPPTDGGNFPSGGGGGGGGSCSPQWECGFWSICNSTLQQARICNDLKNCQLTKIENRSCEPCPESWVCSLWSDCQYGTQYRTCVDSHYCGTEVLKPYLQKSCQDEVVPGPQPYQISQEMPPPMMPAQPATIPEKSFWQKYYLFIIIPAGLILLAAIILLVLYLVKSKKKVYNFGELKDWIKQERNAGTKDADIKKILAQRTGWTDEEVVKAFKELGNK